MALITCKECSAKISDSAKQCPQCGAKNKTTSRLTIFIAGLFLIFIIKGIYDKNSDPAAGKVATKTAAEVLAEAQFQKIVNILKTVKQNTKNPKSFELVSAGLTGLDVVCIQFRATNSFNAVVPGVYVVTDKESGSTTKLWNTHCGGQQLTDFTYARRAL